jgi:putative restriction endonuclease
MANAIFSASEGSAYDDQLEKQYHFPRTYLEAVKQSLGSLIIYYEPRRDAGPSSAGGRQSYFAVAKVESIDQDPSSPDRFYARMANYLEFDQAVPFKAGDSYFESILKKEDGSTNKGAFGRSVRLVPPEEFSAILNAGFATLAEPWENAGIEEPIVEYQVHPLVTQVLTRRFRDRAFKRHVRAAYANTCAITGFKLINGGGRPEVQAAHIRPVEHDGPDTVRNGLALTGTLHWLFDRGLISLGDDHRILVASQAPLDQINRLVDRENPIRLPSRQELRPHPTYLKWHRENCFKG